MEINHEMALTIIGDMVRASLTDTEALNDSVTVRRKPTIYSEYEEARTGLKQSAERLSDSGWAGSGIIDALGGFICAADRLARLHHKSGQAAQA